MYANGHSVSHRYMRDCRNLGRDRAVIGFGGILIVLQGFVKFGHAVQPVLIEWSS